jgi:hypothetical protein
MTVRTEILKRRTEAICIFQMPEAGEKIHTRQKMRQSELHGRQNLKLKSLRKEQHMPHSIESQL